MKQHASKTIFWPTLEYSQTVWDPHTAWAAQRIEAVQCRAARYVCNCYHHTSTKTQKRLHMLKWQSLDERRRLARVTMFFKIHHYLVSTPMRLTSKNLTEPMLTLCCCNSAIGGHFLPKFAHASLYGRHIQPNCCKCNICREIRVIHCDNTCITRDLWLSQQA